MSLEHCMRCTAVHRFNSPKCQIRGSWKWIRWIKASHSHYIRVYTAICATYSSIWGTGSASGLKYRSARSFLGRCCMERLQKAKANTPSLYVTTFFLPITRTICTGGAPWRRPSHFMWYIKPFVQHSSAIADCSKSHLLLRIVMLCIPVMTLTLCMRSWHSCSRLL